MPSTWKASCRITLKKTMTGEEDDDNIDTGTEDDDHLSQDSGDERPIQTAPSGRGTGPTGHQMCDDAIVCMAFEPASMEEIDSLLAEPAEALPMQDEASGEAAALDPAEEKNPLPVEQREELVIGVANPHVDFLLRPDLRMP
eukprot:g54877.t1